MPVDAAHTEAPPFGTVPVDVAHAEAVRLGAASPAPPAPPAGTTYANGTYTHVAPSAAPAAPANGAPTDGTYATSTPANGAHAPAPPPATSGAVATDGTAAYGAPGVPGTAPGDAVYREPVYREAPLPERPAGTAGDDAAPDHATPADAASDDGTAAADGAVGDATPGDPAASDAAPPDTASAVAVDAALVDAVLGEAAGTGADDEDGDERIRTLIWTAATYRPLEEVAALVTQLKNTNAVDSPADEALRAAAVARPLDEVRQLVAMLNAAGHTLDDSDTTLRAAAVGRPIEDVVQLVSILGSADGTQPPVAPGATPGTTAGSPVSAPLPSVPENPHVRPPRSLAGAAAPVKETKVLDREPAAGDTAPSSRSGLRWPAAAGLFACGIIHLPTDFAGLRAGGYVDALALVVTVLCVVLGEWLIVRDSPRVWGFAAAASVGVVALHGMAGSSGFALLNSSLGRSWAWSGAAAVTCAMVTALLAGSALLRRQRQPDATDGA
ncbi:hypothetical protein GCM10010274_29460 [Streptomyces lavendofoliae]|uniref:Uncharacterized protein n=1 Tax=Streptomyces lavendofoliae TaxID=67314 RepID=A0A918M4Z1_9ACTN|nr:hypothetical protein GCM10010274_29460 [Streptomyces lavendofoliae]